MPKPGELPPEPEFPRRMVTPPPRGSGEFEVDAKTPARAHTVLQYQAVIQVFDALSPAGRVGLVEVCTSFETLSPLARKFFVELAQLFGAMSPSALLDLLELAGIWRGIDDARARRSVIDRVKQEAGKL